VAADATRIPHVGAWFATLKPFVIRDPGEFRTPGPPPLTSAAYARDLNEVKALGSATSTARTPDQTEAAIWWDDPRLVEWEIKRQLATTQRLDTLQTARMFAMADIAAVDTLVACYQEKRFWSFWRPVTAVPLADTGGNPATRRRPSLDATAGHGAVSGVPLRARLLHLGDHGRTAEVLRSRRYRVQRLQRRLRHDPPLRQLLGGHDRAGRGEDLGGCALPLRLRGR
jgi:hypothetical protein